MRAVRDQITSLRKKARTRYDRALHIAEGLQNQILYAQGMSQSNEFYILQTCDLDSTVIHACDVCACAKI